MVESMVAHTMSFGQNPTKEVGVFAYVVAHDKECRLDAKAGERVKHKGRRLGYGSVVEGEIDSLHRRIHAPDGVGI